MIASRAAGKTASRPSRSMSPTTLPTNVPTTSPENQPSIIAAVTRQNSRSTAGASCCWMAIATLGSNAFSAASGRRTRPRGSRGTRVMARMQNRVATTAPARIAAHSPPPASRTAR